MNQRDREEARKAIQNWKVVSGILAVLLTLIIVHAYVYGGQESVRMNQLRKEFPLIDIARHFIPQEHFLSTLQPLRERVRALIKSEAQDTDISVYIEYLNTGANININPEMRFYPASLAKIPIALAVMSTIEKGIWTEEQVLTLEDDDRAPLPSTLHTLPTGTQFKVKEILEELLVRSDNTAYRILLRAVPESEIKAAQEGIGLEGLFDEKGTVTSKEFSRAIRSLYVASYLSRANSQFLLELLDRAEFREFLRTPIPSTIPFPHKYGTFPFEHTYNDSGIVYLPNRPYLITVMIRQKTPMDPAMERERVTNIMRAISNMSFEFMSTAKD